MPGRGDKSKERLEASSPQFEGFERTLDVLTHSANEAANDLLIAGLNNSRRKAQYGFLRAILHRRSGRARFRLIRQWHGLLDHLKMIVAESPGRMVDAIREALRAGDLATVTNACDAAQWVRDYDLIQDFIDVAERKQTPHGDVVAQALLECCERLRDEAAQASAKRGALANTRNRAAGKLALSVERFGNHGREEIVEAFLLLAGCETPALRRILRDPAHAAHETILDALMHSPRGDIIRLMCDFLSDQHMPLAVINAVGKRCDLSFLRTLFKSLSAGAGPPARKNLKRLERIVWAREDLSRIFSLSDLEQAGAVEMAVHSGISRDRLFDLLVEFYENGNVGGRRTAVAGLVTFHGKQADETLVKALNDHEPVVQAEAVRQLRERRIPGAISRLIQLVESPHEIVRDAARESLSEFNVMRYLSVFDSMDVEARINTGRLVQKVDCQATLTIVDELQRHNRSRRLRALQAAPAMGIVPEIEDIVIAALSDEDHFVRVEAARALGTCDTPRSRSALHLASAGDSSVVVRQTAAASLKELAKNSAFPAIDGFDPGISPSHDSPIL